MNKEEIEQILQDGTSDGKFEVVEGKDGTARYKLSDYGQVKAQQTIASEGLPFLIMVMSKMSPLPTVKQMADEAVKKFPPELRREAKKNFAPFWGEYGDMTPEQYLEAYTEV